MMSFRLPPLPYAHDALEPYMSARTLQFHHAKHHQAYIDATNKLTAGTSLESSDLVSVIREARRTGHERLGNQAGQVWNHSFFWHSLSPAGGRLPAGPIAELIDGYGGYQKLAADFKAEALAHFGSGWTWLCAQDDQLVVTSLHDGDCPAARPDLIPLITLDVWEHAYYLDYQNARAAFVDAFLGNLVNWSFANENLDGRGAERVNQYAEGSRSTIAQT